MDSNDVRGIGICGMGGIGKTTIAKTFYNRNVNKFDISCFHENFEQYSQGVTSLLPPLEQLLIDLLRKKNYKVFDVDAKIRKLKQILHTKKALIVLDDLDQTHYPILLASLSNFFSAGSRIIITTRDADLLNKLKVVISEVEIYMVQTLGEDDSLKLFSYHAFRKPVPPESFRELSLNFVTHAGGLPLALKVLGSSLLGKTHDSFWKEKLEKVTAIPEDNIQKILQLSYDELDDDTQKAIFLDVAFFFMGKDKDEATYVFKSCDFFPGVGIQNLVDKCLLSIDKYNRFEMHNLIQDMGRELGKTTRTRLFVRGNVWKELPHLEGINDIEGLILDLTTSTHGQATTFLFQRMANLRLLQIIGAPNIKGNFKNLFPNLRCIRWHSCPWTHIPSTFCPPKLVSLNMPLSKFKILWKGPKVGQHRHPFEAHLPNREVAEWFDYKSSGCSVSFDITPSFGSNFLGLALWVVYTCKASKEKWTCMRAVITNDTEGVTENYPIQVHTRVGEAKSSVKCITGEKISMKSGDRIKVSIPSLLYSDHTLRVLVGREVKVKMFGVHVIQK